MTDHTLMLTFDRGCASYVEREVAMRGIGTKTESFESVLLVHGCSKRDLVKAAYLLQTPFHICWLVGKTNVEMELEELDATFGNLITDTSLEDYLPKEKTFLVHCHRDGTHDFNSVDAAQEVGKLIKDHYKEQTGVATQGHVKKPDVLFHLHIDEEDGFLGVDLLGENASKRSYKVFNNPHSMKGPVAASLLMAAEWNSESTLLDPFSSGGVVAIEAALLATGRSLHYYDKKLACKKHPYFIDIAEDVISTCDEEIISLDSTLINAFDQQLRNVTAAKKNAKIGGVEKDITFSKLDLDWIETKFDDNSVDCVVTQPIESSKHIPESKSKKLHKELFFGLKCVMKKKGRVVFLCQKPEELIAVGNEFDFNVITQKQIFTGKLPQWVLVVGKQ